MLKYIILGLIPAALAENYNFPAVFKLDTVDSTTKNSWCQAQMNTCPELCGGGYSVNTCAVETLEYNCTCEDGTQPDVSKYRFTVPFFVCEDAFRQCIDEHPNDLFGQKRCLDEKNHCPSQDPALLSGLKPDDHHENTENTDDEAETLAPDQASSTKPSKQHRAQPTAEVYHSSARALCAGSLGMIVLLTGFIMAL